jgi:spermidine synthase
VGSPVARASLLMLAAGLAGASGLGLEVLAIDLAGLTLGYGSAGPMALALFMAGWALGARLAGSWTGPSRRPLIAVGVWLALFGLAVPHLFLGAAGASVIDSWGVTVFALLGLALPQGMFLPILARPWPLGARGNLGALFAANLVGAAAGAWFFGGVACEFGGRGLAAAGAGGCALLAAVVGASVRSEQATASVSHELPRPGVLSPRGAGWIMAGVTAWVGTLEWFGVRLGVVWLGGMQDSLGTVLVGSLLALGVGAVLVPRLIPNSRAGIAALAVLSALSSLSYFLLPLWMPSVQRETLLLRGVLLVGPALLVFGAWVPVLHRALEGDSAHRLGGLLGWEALGALVGLPLVHFVLLPRVGLGGSLLTLFGLTCLFLLRRGPRFIGVAILAAVGLGGVPALFGTRPVLRSPPLANPAFEVRSFTEDAHFAVAVVEDRLLGERTLMTDGFRAAARGRDYAYMRALGHLPLLLHPEPRAVGVLAFGTGTTAGAVSLHADVQFIEVLELSSAVIDQADQFVEVNRGVLDDPRVRVSLGDGRRTLARRAAVFDVLTMEPLLPDSPFGVYLYTEEFYARARTALRPGGLVCQWVPPHALEPATFEAVVGAFTSAFEWSSVWVFGTQVILLGGQAAPQPSAARFPLEDGPLTGALQVLGLETLEGVLARFVLTGDAWPSSERALTDLDPWIVHRPRRFGSVLLADLPLNLALLRHRAELLPAEWWVGLPEGAGRRIEALGLVREAREVRAASDAAARIEAEAASGVGWLDGASARELLGRLTSRTSQRDLATLMLEASERAPEEAGLLRLEAQLQFEEGLRRGLTLLLSGPGEDTAGEAATHLLRAVALRPERADARAYLAVALERLGSDRALKERARALELCPRLHETSAGSWLERLAHVGRP